MAGRRPQLIEEITSRHHNIEGFVLDVTDAQSIDGAVSMIRTRFPDTNVLMPVAGIQLPEDATHPADQATAAGYAALDKMVEQYDQATESLYAPGTDPDPVTVADEVVRVLARPRGQRPFRTVVDFTQSNVPEVNAVAGASARDFINRMGFGELLTVNLHAAHA